MFIGHFGVGFASKRLDGRLSLGTLFLSAQLLDLLWPVFLLLGLEHVRIAPGITAVTPLDFYDYPISHSLLSVFGWGVALGSTYFLLSRNPLGAFVLSAGVVSHWVLDFVTHRRDMPVLPHGPYVGLGLWNSLPAVMVVEVGLFAFCFWVYLRQTKPLDSTGRYALAALVGVLMLIQAGSYFGPPPPSEKAVAWVGLAQWLLIPWGYWVDRHRKIGSPS